MPSNPVSGYSRRLPSRSGRRNDGPAVPIDVLATSFARWDSHVGDAMDHEILLVVSSRGESIGKIIHDEGEETFLVEQGTVFPTDFEFHYESNTAVSEDGALVYSLTAYSEESATTSSPATADVPSTALR